MINFDKDGMFSIKYNVERYKVQFDKILEKPLSHEEKLEKGTFMVEGQCVIGQKKARAIEERWERESMVVDGVPGRCVLIDRSEELSIFADKKLIEMWKEDHESLLYAYNDIQPLSGSAGYILKLKNGKIFEQITIRS